MLGNSPFYYKFLRIYSVFFGDIFKDIQLVRVVNNKVETIPIPIKYAAQSRQIARTRQLYNEDTNAKQFATTFPRLTFELVDLAYDPSRKKNSNNRQVNQTANSVSSVYEGVPYNINFLLSIYIKNVDDGSQIIEQILPFFNPVYTGQLVLPPLGKTEDIPVHLTNVSLRDTYEGSDEDTRYIIWSMEFTVYGKFTSGLITNTPTILTSTVRLGSLTTSNTISNNFIEIVTVQPGQTANGQPTNISELSINPALIDPNSDYGFCVNIDDPEEL